MHLLHVPTDSSLMKKSTQLGASLFLKQNAVGPPLDIVVVADGLEKLSRSAREHFQSFFGLDAAVFEDATYDQTSDDHGTIQHQVFISESKYLIKDIKSEYILHTTNFSKGNIFRNRLTTKNQLLKYQNKIAIPGDIVFARVGSSCIGNVGYIEKGFPIFAMRPHRAGRPLGGFWAE